MSESGQRVPGDVRQGFVAAFPLWLGVAPFGIVFALAARQAGLHPVQVSAMSLLVYAGAAQFAAVNLIGQGAGMLSVILSTLLINLRHLLLGGVLSGGLAGLSARRRAALAWLVTDESFALSVGKGPGFLLGAGVSLYLCWQLSTLAGIALGASTLDPMRLGLDLVFPLTFAVMLVPQLRSPAALSAALAAGVLAPVLGQVLPGGLHILLATVLGSLIGTLWEGRKWKRG